MLRHANNCLYLDLTIRLYIIILCAMEMGGKHVLSLAPHTRRSTKPTPPRGSPFADPQDSLAAPPALRRALLRLDLVGGSKQLSEGELCVPLGADGS